MQTSRVRCGAASGFALILLLALGASGCRQKRMFYCGDQTVDVNTKNGAQPQAIYVCEGDTVTWRPNGHKFLVEFKKDSPFDGDRKEFDEKRPTSTKTKRHTELTVYEYRITVDGTVFDPQVIGGGGTP